MSHVKNFEQFINESINDNKDYWNEELSELAYRLEELNAKYKKNYVFTYDGSKDNPLLFVNGTPFYTSFMSPKEDVGGVLVPSESHTVVFIQSEDDDSSDYTIGSEDATEAYEMIMRKV